MNISDLLQNAPLGGLQHIFASTHPPEKYNLSICITILRQIDILGYQSNAYNFYVTKHNISNASPTFSYFSHHMSWMHSTFQ